MQVKMKVKYRLMSERRGWMGMGLGGRRTREKGREQVDACDGQESQSAEKRSEVNRNQGQTQNQRTGALLGCLPGGRDGWKGRETKDVKDESVSPILDPMATRPDRHIASPVRVSKGATSQGAGHCWRLLWSRLAMVWLITGSQRNLECLASSVLPS